MATQEWPADDRVPTTTSFRSILFPHAEESAEREEPGFFRDLNLDQVIFWVTSGWKEYELAGFFHSPLHDLDAIAYRHEIFRELERDAVMKVANAFADRMRGMRKRLALSRTFNHRYESERWFLAAADLYCEAVERLRDDLQRLDLTSRGLRAFRDYLEEYADSVAFRGLTADTSAVKAGLSTVRYALLIDGSSITVRPCEDERDYSVVVEKTFEKFRSGAVKDYRAKFAEGGRLNHVEAEILQRVARLYPGIFGALVRYCADHHGYVDETIARFDREVHFYIAYLASIEELRRGGLSFCYPEISDGSKEVGADETFDLALARKLFQDARASQSHPKSAIVTNDFFLRGAERLFVVSGPNQGGKTTFARTFGQLHYLGALGCPVPGTRARLFLFDNLFTHFEREEDIQNLRGKLKDDLVRIRDIVDRATSDSIVIINEIFSSTTIQDALGLSTRVLETLSRLDVLGVCVTFLTELATLDERTVSVVATIDPRDPTVRTYKVQRRRADGLAYALAIADKYGVTYERLRERIRR